MIVNVICMKWGTKYGSEYVNRLYGMVARNLTLSFRFVCFTDDRTDIRPEVEVQPLPSLQLPNGIPERGWMKLATFAQDFGDLEGLTLFLDLDVVIVDSIDAFFVHGLAEQSAVFLAYDQKKRNQRVGNSSVYRFMIGEHPHILEYFRKNTEEIRHQYRNEQAYLSDQLNQKNQLGFWPTAWCPSFKYHCVPDFPESLWKAPSIPEGAKVLLFHGHPEPEQAMHGISGKWYRHFRPCPWIADYWKA